VSTGAIIAIVVAVIVIFALLAVLVPRSRERREVGRLQSAHRGVR
jgi:hypothetical protein